MPPITFSGIFSRIKIIAPVIGVFSFSSAAFATDNVSSPYVEKGKLQMENRFGYDNDDVASKDEKKADKLVINYGVTNRLRPEIKLVLADSPGQDLKITGMETGIRYQFLKPEESWVAAAIDGNYKTATQSNKSDKIEVKLILGKKIGRFSNAANMALSEEVGENSRDGLSFKTAWKTNYKVNDHFAPGFEFYSDTGNLRDSPDYDEQDFRIGPAVSGRINDNVKYNAAYLFGASDDAVDSRFKLILAYSKNF